MLKWSEIITEKTIDSTSNPLEFTKKAGYQIQSLIRKEDFSERDSERILQYLTSQSEIIPFGEYLKRYIFLKSGIEGDFKSIDETEYKKYLKDAFSKSHTPRSFHRTTTSLGVLISGWLSAGTVSREAVFLLGFALQMPVDDVSMFLTKAICEQDFKFNDPVEIIYWYCLKNGLSAMHAMEMMEVYESNDILGPSSPSYQSTDKQFEVIDRIDAVTLFAEKSPILLPDGPTIASRKLIFHSDMTEKELFAYLSDLKRMENSNRFSLTANNCFRRLMEQAKSKIERINRETDVFVFGKEKERKSVREAEVEKNLYSGVPLDKKGNIMNINFSTLGKEFAKHRLTRQRMSRLLSGKAAVTRYDLLTLLFFVSSLDDDECNPISRYKKFVKEADTLLRYCYMGEINISNLYEAFILVCLLTEDPLNAFSEVWELSYS